MFGRTSRNIFFLFFSFFYGIVNLICEFRYKFFINLQLQQINNLRLLALFLRNLRSVAGKFTYSVVVCGNTYIPSRFLNVEYKCKELSHKPVLENFSTSASLHSLILDRQNHPNTVLLSYLNINSLRYKITDLRILVPQFLPHYLVISETKLNKEFPNAQILISDYEIKSGRDRNKHGGGYWNLSEKV